MWGPWLSAAIDRIGLHDFNPGMMHQAMHGGDHRKEKSRTSAGGLVLMDAGHLDSELATLLCMCCTCTTHGPSYVGTNSPNLVYPTLVCTLSCYSVPHMEDCILLGMHTAAQLKPGQERLRRFDMDVDLGLRVVGVPTSSLRVSVQYPAV